jgi:peptidoglycan/xylan/chitin deacetylase (PgdA/CDA1 family)
MRLLHQAFATSYPAFNLLRKLRYFTGYDRSIRLRVLLYHDIAPQEHADFERQLGWLSRHWTFISPEKFAAVISGKEKIQNKSLLLTFDDGFASNLTVAQKILNPMGIQALFFVVSDLVAIEDPEEALKFIVRHVQPGLSIEKLPAYLNNMKWSDLESLLEQGHTIGAHTRTHARLSEISSSDGLEEEIVSSADSLGNRLGVHVEHFAYTFGDLASFSSQALRVAQKRFRYVYSSLRGNNTIGTSSYAIRRDVLTPSDSNSLVGAFLEGGADFLYRSSLNNLDYWAGRKNC